jgi:hypothetical protein
MKTNSANWYDVIGNRKILEVFSLDIDLRSKNSFECILSAVHINVLENKIVFEVIPPFFPEKIPPKWLRQSPKSCMIKLVFYSISSLGINIEYLKDKGIFTVNRLSNQDMELNITFKNLDQDLSNFSFNCNIAMIDEILPLSSSYQEISNAFKVNNSN